MRDPRDAYERDVANSTSGFGKDSQAYRADGGGNDERHDLDPTEWYIVKDGKMFKATVYPNQEQKAISLGYSRTRDEAKAKATQQGMAEGSQRVDSLVTDALKVMRGSGLNDAVQALKTVLGDREYNDRRGHYNFYVRQLVDMYGQQGIAEGISDLGYEAQALITKLRRDVEEKRLQPTRQAVLAAASELAGNMDFAPELLVQQVLGKGITEGNDYSAVTGAITRRIITQHPEVLAKYGPAIVSQAIDEIADFVGEVDEIGSSDVSGWVSQVIRSLGRFAPVRDEGVAEGHTEVKDKQGKVVSWKDDSEWHRAEKNKQGQPKDPRGVVTHLSDVARRKTTDQQGMAEGDVDSDGYSVDHADSGEYDYEGDQARDQMNTIVRAARRLDGMLDDNENMPEWVQMKVTLAADYLDTAADYIESNQEPELDEGERGRGRPPSSQQDTTPVMPGRVEKTATGIRHHADASRYGGTEPDDEDNHLMSKSHISRLGKMTEPDIDEGEKVGNMDADRFDAAMSRLKQLAGAGPMKTVYDPAKRVYRNVPTAVQPKK
jgi:hypothetical protein